MLDVFFLAFQNGGRIKVVRDSFGLHHFQGCSAIMVIAFRATILPSA